MGLKQAWKLDAARVRVPLGLTMGVLGVLMLRPSTPEFVWTGLAIAFSGLLVRAWAAGCIKKAKVLATSGPYALVRHPLYLGSSLLAVGFSVCVTSPAKPFLALVTWGAVAVYFALVYSSTIKKEERHLSDKFGATWTDYRRQTPALVPYRLGRLRDAFPSSYSFRQYVHNREYEAAIGWAAACFVFFVVI